MKKKLRHIRSYWPLTLNIPVCIAQWLAFSLSTLRPGVWFSVFPRNFLLMLLNSTTLWYLKKFNYILSKECRKLYRETEPNPEGLGANLVPVEDFFLRSSFRYSFIGDELSVIGNFMQKMVRFSWIQLINWIWSMYVIIIIKWICSFSELWLNFDDSA